MKSSSGVDLKQSWGSSACWEQHWISLPASENSEKSVSLQFGTSSTGTVGNSLIFPSMYFSCCPKLPQPVSRADLFAQCPFRPWLGVSSGASSSCRHKVWCQHSLPSPRQGRSSSRFPAAKASGWPGLGTSIPSELVPGGLPQHLCTRLGTGARFPGGYPRAQQAVAAHG